MSYFIIQMKKHLYKVLILGDPGVGKTSMMNAYVNKQFTHIYKATIGADFLTKDIYVGDDDVVTLQIWDTSGQERYNSLGMPFYRGADCCIFMYDVTRPTSIENIQMWYNQLQTCIDPIQFDRMTMVLVGNKTDLPRVVNKWRGGVIANKHNMFYIEASIKAMENVNAPFEHVANCLLKKEKESVISSDIPREVYLVPEKVEKKRSCC